MNSIYFKNFMAMAVIVLTSFLIVGVSFVFILRYFVMNDARENMVANAEQISRNAAAMTDVDELEDWDTRMSISMLSEATGNHIFLCDKDGVVISCSDKSLGCGHIGKQIPKTYITAINSNGQLEQLTDLNGFYDSVRVVVAEPIDIDNTLAGYVFVSKDSSVIVGAYGTFMYVFVLTITAVMSLAMVLSLVFSKQMTKSLDEMAVAARKYSHGDFSMRVSTTDRADEMGALTDSFNEMADSLEKAERSRQEFIANVSHELKTPIALIQGYAEGLKLGINSDPEGSEEYCDIILEETGKMNRIVMELLNLEKLESGSYVPTCEKLDLSAMIKGQLAAFSMMFNDNGIKLIDRIPDGLTVHSDERTILLVLQNFLSNAVSNIGGKKIVQLTVEDNLNTYRVSVYNSGDPIAEDELDKIWYSFYKSSKKRKNEDFHFGLGLPIVKAIQKRLGRECGVVNEHGGVRFWFDVDK